MVSDMLELLSPIFIAEDPFNILLESAMDSGMENGSEVELVRIRI